MLHVIDWEKTNTEDHYVILCDIDGTISEVTEEEFWFQERTLGNSVAKINKWYDEGHYVVFWTAREEDKREGTEKWLEEKGFKYHVLLMGKPGGSGKNRMVWIDDKKISAIPVETDVGIDDINLD